MPRRVAVLAPMPSELRPVAKRMHLTAGADGVYSGKVGTSDVTATRTGMGMSAAAAAASSALDAGAEHVVVVGIAGGIGDIDIGTLVVPERVASAKGEHRPAALGSQQAAGAIWTSDELIVDPDRIGALVRDGYVALDMETAAVAEVCEARGVPWSVFRSISDRPADKLVDAQVFGLANQDGSPNLPAAARFVLTRPWKIPALGKLARGAALAARVAADAAATALERWED